jgi:hypothetical protein
MTEELDDRVFLFHVIVWWRCFLRGEGVSVCQFSQNDMCKVDLVMRTEMLLLECANVLRPYISKGLSLHRLRTEMSGGLTRGASIETTEMVLPVVVHEMVDVDVRDDHLKEDGDGVG